MNKIPVEIVKKMIEYDCCQFTVMGHSMEPFLYENTIVSIVKTEYINVNDVVLYQRDGKYILHRVVSILENVVITKGDNNRFVDYAIERENILGKMKTNHSIWSCLERHEIVYNIWDEETYSRVKENAKRLSVNIMNEANRLFDDGINIVDSPYVISKLCDINWKLMNIKEKIYVHVGVPISDHFCEEFVLYSEFDAIFRSGTYTSCYLLPKEEQFLLLYNEIEHWRNEI